jgi:DNA-binding LacI/PurR family transcriptional regulator
VDAADHNRSELITSRLRERILAGDYPAGARLPTRAELLAEFGVASATMQRALDRLIEDGFAEARGRQGTFVPDFPPHLFRYGLALPLPAAESAGNGFLAALVAESSIITRGMPQRFTTYFGIHQADGEAARRLAQDVAARRIAGLLFAVIPYPLAGSPILAGPVPCAAISSPHPGFPTMGSLPLTGSWLDRAIEHVRAAGCRSLAYLGPQVEVDRQRDRLAALPASGIATRPSWWLGFRPEPSMRRPVQQAVSLLLDRPDDERPEALLIADDNLVAPAAATIRAAGGTRPGIVVAHANFPAAPPPIPCRRLGYDARRVLRQGLLLLERMRDGRPPATIDIPLQFEDELPTAPR